MRGGAWAPALWALLLLVLGAINVIWTTGNIMQGGEFLAAIGSILALAVLLATLSPEARRRGAPEPDGRPEAVPSASLGAAMAGLAFGCFVFGFAFGHFPIYFGAGLLIVSLVRWGIELRAQRAAHARWLTRDEP